MEKNKAVRLLLWLSLLFVVALFIVEFTFLTQLPAGDEFQFGYYGIINSNIFKAKFTALEIDTVVINTPLIGGAIFLLFNGFMLFYSIRGEELKHKFINEIIVYNVVIALLLVISSIVYMILIPDIVNGFIENNIIMTKIPRQADQIINVYNFNFVLLIVYSLLNMYTLFKTAEKKLPNDTEFEEGELLL